MVRRTLGRRRRLAGVGGLHRRGWDGGVPGTTWLGLALGDFGISGDGVLGYSSIGTSTNGAGSSSNPKCGGGVGARSVTTKGWNFLLLGETQWSRILLPAPLGREIPALMASRPVRMAA
jgi:hypothetical protein